MVSVNRMKRIRFREWVFRNSQGKGVGLGVGETGSLDRDGSTARSFDTEEDRVAEDDEYEDRLDPTIEEKQKETSQFPLVSSPVTTRTGRTRRTRSPRDLS